MPVMGVAKFEHFFRVAAGLDSLVPGEGEIYARKFSEMQPHWWVPFADANLGAEANVQQPADSRAHQSGSQSASMT